ncbi:cytochrome c biogenesis protein, partial [Singulisphaera rosea]
MKRFGWLLLGLPLAWAVGFPVQAADSSEGKKTVGIGQAYERLGKLPVMHAGRKKPFDTVAREEVKQIFGRETITLHDDANKVVGAWGPIGAAFDWAVRPEFWDDQPFILTEYLPLKRLILADVIKARLDAAAA